MFMDWQIKVAMETYELPLGIFLSRSMCAHGWIPYFFKLEGYNQNSRLFAKNRYQFICNHESRDFDGMAVRMVL